MGIHVSINLLRLCRRRAPSYDAAKKTKKTKKKERKKGGQEMRKHLSYPYP